ncbi:MAG: UDP-N-acetylglucosamine 2-epimerase, partial [Nitrospirae bacterium]|nr:UDP-N-acetylglucosamine 2-epimerase [Nitrospirota bacterium]
RVREVVFPLLEKKKRIKLLEPLDYPVLIKLMKRSYIILTDSGGIQEEAPTFGVPVLVMRNCTERPEGVEAGVAKLVGTQKDTIVKEAIRLLTETEAHAVMSNRVNPYGDGLAAKRIVSILLGRLYS